jgi:glycosyltransferase involved in cell wall biosynthesis
MNVLVASETLYPNGGGAELATWLYLKMLSEEQLKIAVLTKQTAGQPSTIRVHTNLTIYRIPFHLGTNSRYDTLVNAPQLLRSATVRLFRECDLVYIPGNWFAAAALAKICGKPVLLHAHNYALACPLSLMYDPLLNQTKQCTARGFYWHERMMKGSLCKAFASTLANATIGRLYFSLAKLADSVVLVSKAQYELITAHMPYIREKSHLIRNPLPEDVRFVPIESMAVAYFGGLEPNKGFHIIWQAAHELANIRTSRNKISIYLVGTSSRPVVREWKTVRLHLMPWVSRPKALEILQRSSVVVFPSLSPEPSPYVVAEALLAGRLLVASRVGGVPEIVGNSAKGAWLVKPGSVIDLVTHVSEALVMEPQELNESSEKNMQAVRDRYDSVVSKDALLSVMQSLVR